MALKATNNLKDLNSSVNLNNGIPMPWIGLGTFRVNEGKEVLDAVGRALADGYRSIDTAALYANEEGVGKAIRQSGIARNEIFLTTKVWNSDQGYDKTLKAFDASLKRLAMDYVDLYLVHWPVSGKFKETWKALEEIYASGRARAIGVSNFMIHHLEDLLGSANIIPAVNQYECHPYLVLDDLRHFCLQQGIRPEAWSPIMKGRLNRISKLVEIGEKYGKTPAQITLRWELQHGIVVIPKTVHKERMAENADLFDFTLSDEDMNSIDQLDRNERTGPDPDHFNF